MLWLGRLGTRARHGQFFAVEPAALDLPSECREEDSITWSVVVVVNLITEYIVSTPRTTKGTLGSTRIVLNVIDELVKELLEGLVGRCWKTCCCSCCSLLCSYKGKKTFIKFFWARPQGKEMSSSCCSEYSYTI